MTDTDGLGDVLAGAPMAESLEEADRPALAQLSHDQMALLDTFLDGFETRRAVLLWMQEVAIQSLGQLGDTWFKRQVTDPTTMSALLNRPWGPVEDAELTAEWMRSLRRDIAAKDLLGAFHGATASFRWSATEAYDADEYDRGGEFHEQDPALRPGLGHMQETQQWALRRLLAGFADEDALLVWGQFVTRASYAEIDRQTVKDAYFDLTVREWMTTPDDPDARFWRETWAAKYLLPAFNRAAARVASRASEVPKHSSSMTVPQG